MNDYDWLDPEPLDQALRAREKQCRVRNVMRPYIEAMIA